MKFNSIVRYRSWPRRLPGAKIRVVLLILGIIFLGAIPISALDVSLIPPDIFFGPAIGDLPGATEWQQRLNDEVRDRTRELQRRIESDPDILRFSDLSDLARGFSNSAAAAAHAGTQRPFHQYQHYAVTAGIGATATVPGMTRRSVVSAVEKFEERGDIYGGVSVQPLVATFGINTDHFLSRTRVELKAGLSDLKLNGIVPARGVVSELTIRTLGLGASVHYRVVGRVPMRPGLIDWSGVSVGTGILFQQNEATVEVQIPDLVLESAPIVLGELGIGDSDLAKLPIDSSTILGELRIVPRFTAIVRSQTVSIPIEAYTGITIFRLVTMYCGVGVDVAAGMAVATFGSNVRVIVDTPSTIEPYLSTGEGAADLNISTWGVPQIVRPFVSAGFAVRVGRFRVGVPGMLYFERGGNTVTTGLSVGYAW